MISSSTPPAVNVGANSNAPTTNTPSGVLGAGIQDGNAQWPSFEVETNVDGSIVYRCECGRAITRKKDLRRHWRSRMHGGRGFDCQECGKSYIRKYMLDQHVCQAATPVDVDR
jgi:hypothetical protein